MTWTDLEAKQAEAQETEGYMVELHCPECDETWSTRERNDILVDDGCPQCGGIGTRT